MMLADCHVHTCLCDGYDTPELIAERALNAGLCALGFSGHSFTSFDASWCMTQESTREYRQRVAALKKEYAGRLKILTGIEQDFYADEPPTGYDFVIGSVHYIDVGGAYAPVDEPPDMFMGAVKSRFGGDIYAFLERYFETVGGVAEKTGCDIIGHLDIVSKFNGLGALFDPEHPRYVAAYTAAVERLVQFDRPFEISTAPIWQGHLAFPYPSRPIMECIRDRGGRFVLSSDSHRASTLCFQFQRWADFAKELGLKLVTPGFLEGA